MKKKIIYLEAIRIIAILLIIFNHTDGYFYYFKTTENILTYLFSLVGSVVCRTGVPLFIMISGALLLEKEETIREILRKRVLRIVIVTILFSFMYYIIKIIRISELKFSFLDFFLAFLGGTIQDSFWFLYIYAGLLLLLPFLRKLAMNLSNREFLYLIILRTIFGIIRPVFTELTGIHVSGELYLLDDFIFYMLLGYYLNSRVNVMKFDKKCLVAIVCMILVSIVGAGGITIIHFVREGEYDPISLDLFTPLIAQCIFLYIKYLCVHVKFSNKLNNGILLIGSCVFGIYLFEQLARIQLLPIYLFLTKYTFGILACTVYVLSSFLLAYVYTLMAKKIPWLGKLI